MSLGKWLNPAAWGRPRDFESRLASLQPELQRHRERAAEARQQGGAELRYLLAKAECERAELIKTIADRAGRLGVEWTERHDGLLLDLIAIDARTGQSTDTETLRGDLLALIEDGRAHDAKQKARQALGRALEERTEAVREREEERTMARILEQRRELIDLMATRAKELESSGRPDAAAEWERQQEKTIQQLLLIERTAGMDSDAESIREELRRRIAEL
ncbi:hypothetical protein O4J56_30555 [Nocardiopsis sp. RSe5-2]|uniref:PspA/IM30 family protein n=1 Tax=Nocardiopsis endophytica TaxID=3018445 RepID=A0ABT4UDJ1_9ACTN|nr:hypothetical protein [Nocardiopsis endophytica]MDA2815026.1 hypothetical protein [Nocardiopsis endophytica]